MNTGTVKFFNEHKGFGFITQDNGGSDVFVHVSDLVDEQGGSITLVENQKVEFTIYQGKKGPQAKDLKVL